MAKRLGEGIVGLLVEGQQKAGSRRKQDSFREL
jgi:hypothetical protein